MATVYNNNSTAVQTLQEEEPEDAYVLAFDYINWRLNARNLHWPDCPELPPEPSRVQIAIRKVGEHFERTYCQELSSLSAEFSLDPSTSYTDFWGQANGIFNNGQEMDISWGRIVALFAWSGVLAVKAYQAGKRELISNIAEWVAVFTETRLLLWIESHGGWVR